MRIKIASAALLMAELGGLAAPVFASNAASSSSAATGKNISETTALEDLSTDEAFDEADYPAKAALGKDAFGKDESEWQAIACTDGLADFSQTYFYFYHPLANPPKWTDSASGNETYDVAFRLSMATTGSLDAYVHYSLELKNSSQDLRFFKFVLNFDFAPKMEAASYRCYDISEFEIVDQATTHSNAYKVAKRFSWTYQTDGSFKENSQSIDTIELTPHFASFVIAGINGTTDEVGHGIPLTTTPYTGEPDRVENWLAGTSGGLIPDWSTYARETTSFFAAFPVPKTMGKLCGADVSYRMANDYGLYGSVALLPNLFDQNALRSITTNPSAQISLNRAKLQADNPAMWKSESKTVRLSTGLDSDWVGVSGHEPDRRRQEVLGRGRLVQGPGRMEPRIRGRLRLAGHPEALSALRIRLRQGLELRQELDEPLRDRLRDRRMAKNRLLRRGVRLERLLHPTF